MSHANGKILRLTEPSLLFYPRPASHRLRADEDAGVDLICASVEFGGQDLNPVVVGLPALMVVALSAMPNLRPVLEALFAEAFSEHCGRGAALNRLSEVLLIYLLRHAMNEGFVQSGVIAGLADPRLAKAITAIHDEPARLWNLHALAEVAGMSRARFAAHFVQVLGTSPGDYLAAWRISVAQGLLIQGRQVKTIADEVGYGNANALSRAFRQRVGQTPTEWLAARKKAPNA